MKLRLADQVFWSDMTGDSQSSDRHRPAAVSRLANGSMSGFKCGRPFRSARPRVSDWPLPPLGNRCTAQSNSGISVWRSILPGLQNSTAGRSQAGLVTRNSTLGSENALPNSHRISLRLRAGTFCREIGYCGNCRVMSPINSVPSNTSMAMSQ